jgi:hypothetical protein
VPPCGGSISVNVGGYGGSDPIPAGCGWTISSDQYWAQPQTLGGKGPQQVQITVTKNTTGQNRSAKICVTGPSFTNSFGKTMQTQDCCTMTQNPCIPCAVVTPNTQYVGCEAGNPATFEINHGTDNGTFVAVPNCNWLDAGAGCGVPYYGNFSASGTAPLTATTCGSVPCNVCCSIAIVDTTNGGNISCGNATVCLGCPPGPADITPSLTFSALWPGPPSGCSGGSPEYKGNITLAPIAGNGGTVEWTGSITSGGYQYQMSISCEAGTGALTNCVLLNSGQLYWAVDLSSSAPATCTCSTTPPCGSPNFVGTPWINYFAMTTEYPEISGSCIDSFNCQEPGCCPTNTATFSFVSAS